MTWTGTFGYKTGLPVAIGFCLNRRPSFGELPSSRLNFTYPNVSGGMEASSNKKTVLNAGENVVNRKRSAV